MQQLNLTPVVRILLILNIILFVLTHAVAPSIHSLLCLYYPTSPFFQPFQILSHMFMHHGLGHLFFNMMGLAMFGPMIEMVWREQRFLGYYLACGLGAVILPWAYNYWQVQQGNIDVSSLEMVRSAGASGCLYGLLVAFAMLYPNQRVGLMFIPVYMKAKYVVPAFAAIELFLGLGNFNTGIGHFAHLGGALVGFLLILFWWRGLK
jgi:membrane associated rhomboid family serine protease